jgi:hypothetical protein
MTPDERALLQTFLGDLTASRPGQKDGEADRMITDALRAAPDAAYVLVQHAIMSDQALHAAQEQIAQMQDQLRSLPAPQPAGSFLSAQSAAPSPWARAATPPPPVQDQYQQPPQQGGGFFGPGPFNRGGGLGSFLRNAGTTAAGVAGGALLFDGISNLFGGHRGFGGMGGGFGGGFGGQPGEVIENNYYGDQGGGADLGGDAGGGWDSGGGGGDGGSFDT